MIDRRGGASLERETLLGRGPREAEPPWVRDPSARRHEWRRLFSELLGTFLLALLFLRGPAALEEAAVPAVADRPSAAAVTRRPFPSYKRPARTSGTERQGTMADESGAEPSPS